MSDSDSVTVWYYGIYSIYPFYHLESCCLSTVDTTIQTNVASTRPCTHFCAHNWNMHRVSKSHGLALLCWRQGHHDSSRWERNYLAWIEESESEIVVATFVFSTGNDYPHVYLVIYLDQPFNMLECCIFKDKVKWGTVTCQLHICYNLVPTKAWKESEKKDDAEMSNEQAMLDHLYLQ